MHWTNFYLWGFFTILFNSSYLSKISRYHWIFEKKYPNENITRKNYKNYFEDKDLKKDIIKELDTFWRKNDLKGFELPKKIHLSKERFTEDNQIITPTMKIRRHIAKKYFEKEIKKLYGI